MLSTSKLVGFLATARPADAKRFYEDILELSLLEDGPYALVFSANGTVLRVQKVQAVALAPYTALGWSVSDITATVQNLGNKGVKFQRYEGLPQDDKGIWRTPDGSSVAWFRDPDGNTLSITEHRAK